MVGIILVTFITISGNINLQDIRRSRSWRIIRGHKSIKHNNKIIISKNKNIISKRMIITILIKFQQIPTRRRRNKVKYNNNL